MTDSTAPKRLVGLPWFDRASYPRIRQIMADGSKLPEDHAYWRMSAESIETALRDSGCEVVQVVVDPDSFVAWCGERELPPDGAARMRFAREAVTGT